MPLRSYGLTHAAIVVADLDRAAAFYQRLLGMKVTWSNEKMVELRTPGRNDSLTLELGVPAVEPDGGVRHFGFRLLQPMAAADIAMAVVEAGGTVEEQGEFALGEPYVFARDPDGYLIEIFFEP